MSCAPGVSGRHTQDPAFGGLHADEQKHGRADPQANFRGFGAQRHHFLTLNVYPPGTPRKILRMCMDVPQQFASTWDAPGLSYLQQSLYEPGTTSNDIDNELSMQGLDCAM